MQSMGTVNNILQDISSLLPDEQLFIANTLNKRINELKRTQIYHRTREAEKNYQNGKCVSGSVSDLMRAINND